MTSNLYLKTQNVNQEFSCCPSRGFLIILKTLYNLIQTIQKATVQYIRIKLNHSHSNFKAIKFFIIAWVGLNEWNLKYRGVVMWSANHQTSSSCCDLYCGSTPFKIAYRGYG